MSLVVVGDGVVVGSSQAPVHDDTLHLNPLTTHEALSVSVHGISDTSELASKFTNQNDVTGSRAVNVVYQNTSGGTMLMDISFYASSANGSINPVTDSNAAPTSEVAYDHTGAPTDRSTISFIVLDGNYYKLNITGSTPTIVHWVEWS